MFFVWRIYQYLGFDLIKDMWGYSGITSISHLSKMRKVRLSKFSSQVSLKIQIIPLGFVAIGAHRCMTFDTFFTAWKVSKYRVFSGPYFPVYGMNSEIYGANLHSQSKYRKIRTRKNYVFWHVSRSVLLKFYNNLVKYRSKLNKLIYRRLNCSS